MIKDIKEINFPAYATLETATATIADMGDRTITSQVKIAGDVIPDFSYDWEVEFKGERFIHPVKKPQGTKDNSSRKTKIDLVFQHWAIYEMKRQYFVEMASTTAGTAIADKYIASLGLNLGDFVTAFNLVLNHYFEGRIIIKLNPEWQYNPEAKFVSISYSYIWDVLQQMHEIYGVRWTLKTNAEGVCEILMGYPAEEVSHIFEYGFEGGLLSVQHQVQSSDICNRLLGRGGSKNLPARYFKDKDPNNPLFEADPDWIPELANISFTELRGKTFRDYVRGWKAKRYGGIPMAEPTEAYLAGYNAEKFDPIEYVDDKDSIAKYGVLVGALENNEEIYPSIQGAPGDVDMIVDAEQVTDDDVDAAVENDSVTTNLESGHQTYRNAPANSTITIETLTKRYFSVPVGKVGNLDMSLTVTGKYTYFGAYEPTSPILKNGTVKITIYDKNTDAIITSSAAPVINIPAGDYYYMISADVETNYDKASMVTLNIESVRLYVSTPGVEGWSQTFDIWVRNIWGSSRNAGETDQQYADRVWLPILGDRMGNEARVVFASGWLSFSSDWEFPIVGYAFDDSKPDSHWRLTLAKSEAELEASGKYIPYEGYNASAGDRFFFIGIDMPHQYVLWGEERVDDYKRDALLETAEINPSWVIKTDKVRLNQDREGAVLVDSLNAGSQIRLANKQFISGAYESLYVQSITYNWGADTILYPDVEVVVSDKVATVKNPVAQMQGNIENLQRQVGSLSNIQQIIRQVCDPLYLRKDGVEDISKSPTRFLGKVTGEKFRQGQIGGRDWGIYRDEKGNAILEADKIVARQGLLVSDLVVNEATYVGGLQINSAAAMKITAVEDTDAGYVCYFDQKQGSVTNKFQIDDVALCQKFDPEDNEVKFYKRRVVAIAETSVTLSKTDVNGDGIPAVDDEIIHYGNYTDKKRQFVIIRDVIGGGYERMLMGLDSVTSEGFEYYFAGKSADSQARWFVGDSKQYAKYENGQLTIKGNLLVTGSDKPITDQIAELDYIKDAFGNGSQGLILGKAIIVGYNDDQSNFVPMAGMSGIFDKDSENGGPAAWYGGTTESAKSMIFMDGTGYFANGLFKWDDKTGVNLGNDAIKLNYDGSVVFGKNIRIDTAGNETLGSVLTSLSTISSDVTGLKDSLKDKLDKSVWDSVFEIDAKGNLRAKVGIYSTSFISARTSDPSAGGGSGGGGAFSLYNWDQVKAMTAEVGGVAPTAYALKQAYNELINATPTLSWNNIQDKPIFANVATSGSYSDLIGRPTSLSDLANDVGYITASAIPTSYAWSAITGKPTFAAVATSGSYNDLSNKPSIPSIAGLASESWVSNNFLGLGGGTMTGTITIGSWTAFGVSGSNFYLGSPDYPLLLRSNGTTTINGNTLIHSGNIGSQSVNYASSAGALTTSGNIAAQANSNRSVFFQNYVTFDPNASYGIYRGSYISSKLGAADLYISAQNAIVLEAGKVGIGTTSPQYDLHVDGTMYGNLKMLTPRTIWGQPFDGTGNVDGYMFMSGLDVLHLDNSSLWLNYGAADGGKSLRICGNDVAIYYGKSSNFARAMTINSAGNVGIGTDSPSEKLSVAGNLTASGTIYSAVGLYTSGYLSARSTAGASDRNLKTNIAPVKNALAYILGTKYVSFDWKDTGEHSVGIIAQDELNREWSCLVQKYSEHYSYQYTQHTALLGSALQEEDEKVEALKAEVATLKNKVQKLERQLWQQ